MHSETTDVFAQTIDLTGRWLDEIMGETGWNARRAYAALRAVLHVLRDRLTVDETAHLGAQLPMLVRGLYYEGWRPSRHPLKYRHKEDFLQRIAEHFPGLDEAERESAARAVFKTLARNVTGGEIQDVINQLPADVRALWTTAL
ncbi:MAG TPA: DUF2267 domain-containing protein [Burkholderiales bacterium]|nr:DUF2267 domain-containing protein [Burkholderiales bacterium]